MSKSLDLNAMLKEMQEDTVKWFGEGMQNNLTVMVLGLVGEAGEVADILKKIQRGSKTMEDVLPELKTELIDVFHYWLLIIGMLQIDIQEVYEEKRAYNEQRFNQQ